MMKKVLKYIVFGGVCFGLGIGVYKYKHKLFSEQVVESVRDLPDVSSIPLDTIKITIPDSAYSLLLANRAEALKHNLLTKEYRDKVLATLVQGKDTFAIDLRLKGDKSDHWDHEFKWSFRIKIKEGKALKGIKTFNFQRPKTRGNVNEWFFHQTLREFGLIHLRYKFVKAIINNKDAGIYALEEYFDKRLTENNGLREGITFRFNNAKYWPKEPGMTQNRLIGAPLDPFKMGKPVDGNPLYAQFKVAKDLIGGYINGRYRTSEVFDLGKLATFYAIVDLTGHQHSSSLGNMKFYYNPVTSLIEPVGYDNQVINNLWAQPMLGDRSLLGERRMLDSIKSGTNYKTWYDKLFSDHEFQSAYVYALEQVSNESRLTEYYEKIEKKMHESIALIRVNDPNYTFHGDDIFKQNASYIRRFLKPKAAMEAYTIGRDTIMETVTFEFQNCHYLPLEVLSLKYKDSIISHPDDQYFVQSSGVGKGSLMVTYKVPKVLLKKKKFLNKVKLEFRLIGSQSTLSCVPHHWRYFNDENVETIKQAKNSNFQEFEFVEGLQNNLVIKKGSYRINKDLIIGTNQLLIVEAGTHITLSSGASIICHGGISLNGESGDRISVSSDGGEGILVLNSTNRSKILYTDFNGLSNFEIADWKLPSAVTFYNSDVDIDYTHFADNIAGDDYLNVFRSEVSLTNSSFTNTYADAFDGDFISGIIKNVKFDSIGNDALDFSGSRLKINTVEFSNVMDKGLSAGERTVVYGQNLKFNQCALAVNSKDDSKVDIRNSKISNSGVGYVVFMKKTEYGAASITVSNVELIGCDENWLVEQESKLFIDGVLQKATHKDVKALLYGKKYGKSSK
ncbi:MAG: CotH kinase family protein [Flavobacteriales bacterium]|nr:CotH kinase family protein [Flavobacteriales bacterium]